MADYTKEITKRRTFAIISHPDAGKTTLTEKFLLYGGAINLAGSVKGKATSRHAVSDWMEIEKERGISVIHTSEFLAGTNRPVDGTGGNPQFLFNVIQQIKGIVGISIQLVDKSKNRDMTHGTDFEQLSGLGLHTF